MGGGGGCVALWGEGGGPAYPPVGTMMVSLRMGLLRLRPGTTPPFSALHDRVFQRATLQKVSTHSMSGLSALDGDKHRAQRLKGLAHADLAKKNDFLHAFLLFYVRLLCSINFCFGLVEMRQFRNKCSGLKIDWGSPPGCSCLRNAYNVITFCCFTQLLYTLPTNMTMALSQTRNLLRCNNLSGDLIDDCVNNFMSFYK